jgi:hypothetical protein
MPVKCHQLHLSLFDTINNQAQICNLNPLQPGVSRLFKYVLYYNANGYACQLVLGYQYILGQLNFLLLLSTLPVSVQGVVCCNHHKSQLRFDKKAFVE